MNTTERDLDWNDFFDNDRECGGIKNKGAF